MEQIAKRGNRKPVNIALQGGGAHGAFGWGVLDRLLEDDRLALDALSATSAGAMNAVVMAYGVSLDGRDGARACLEKFWRATSEAGEIWNPIRPQPWEQFVPMGVPGFQSPSFFFFQMLTHIWSPYQLNPLGLNPLRDVLERIVDFDHIQQCPFATRLFLSATNVKTGKVRVFENHELTSDVIMASACLPYLFQAVEIDGDSYWDGGFMGNPAIFPLIYEGASDDVIVVHINPLSRETVPTTAPEIFDRMNEISFNSSLMREMRAIAFVSKLVETNAVDDRRYARMLIHSIADDVEMRRHGVATKMSPDWDFLCRLRDAGRAAASAWLDRHFDDVGRRSSTDIAAQYL
ncbi:MAG: patatin-like phospholipase family protein [Hyphomicrobiaceae bacterium]|nr:patatin-like phospholipase family protein [Hyphomicrobiaceae bacterium]